MSTGSKNKEGVVLLIDVGPAVGQLGSEKECFLDKSKKCASRIVQRKIFSGAKDEFGLVLIGSKVTKNDLDYPNINVTSKYFCCPNWNLLKEINGLSATKVENPDSANGDWLDGLIVAVNLLKNESECKSFNKKKIVLMSNFATPIRSKDHVDDTIEALKDLKISLVVIGLETEDEDNSENEIKSNVQRKGEAIIKRIVEETDGVICEFSEAMAQLGRYQKVTSKAAPWYCDLQIGSNIFIPVVGYKKFDSKKLFTWKKRSVDNSAITTEKVFFEGDQQLEKLDVINSYLFGETVVPFSEDDKAAISLPTEKCFQLIGFTKKINIPHHIFMGDSVLYITSRSGFDGATSAVTALAKALHEQQMFGLVRRVYCKNSAPKLGALIPACENDCYFFYWAQLPFAEDERLLFLPSLKKEAPTEEQLQAVDNLIDSMDLTQLDEDEDPYQRPMNPAVEHMNDLVAFKALNPSSKVPSEPSENIQNMLKPIPEILENAAEALDSIKRLFPLEEIEQRTYRRGAADVFKRAAIDVPVVQDAGQPVVGSIANFVQSTVTEVGTVDPEGNFQALLDQDKPFTSICEQMQAAIKKLMFTSSSAVGVEKAVSALKLLRNQCVSKDPEKYNTFIALLKDDMVQRGKTELWDMIVQERLGLITCDESQKSTVNADEADLFYEMKKFESQEEVQYEMEAEDLLDQL